LIKYYFMSINKVVVRKGTDGYAVTREVMSNLGYDFTALRGKKVLVKPNAGRIAEAGKGVTTHPIVIAAIIDHLLENGVTSITVGESSIVGVKPLDAMESCGIAAVARERSVMLADLDAHKWVEKSIPNGKVINKLRICSDVLDFDFIISVPVMKTHMHTQVSLGLKNMKGCLYGKEKVKLHQLPPNDIIVPPAKPLDYAIVDISKILLPNLTVIDGTYGQEGLGPSAGEPINSGLVIASLNCLAADWVAVQLMGINPAEVHHLRISINSSEGFDLDGSGVTVDPDNYLNWVTPYKRPPSKISVEYLNVKVDDRDSCSACLSTVLMFLKRYYSEFADYYTAEKPLRLAIGKNIGNLPKDTILIGNCTMKFRDGHVFVKGCPPVASEIRTSVLKCMRNKIKG